MKNYFSRGVQRLHTDGRGEYEKGDTNEWSNTTADTSQHNPFPERINRTLLEPIRLILEQEVLSAHYWEYALDHVAYVKNRLPHSAINCSPFEKLPGKKPTLKHIRVFGCCAFVYNEKPCSKVHARGLPGIFLGYDDNGVYMVESFTDGKLMNSVNVPFDESTFPGIDNSNPSSSGESGSESENKAESDQQLVDVDISDKSASSTSSSDDDPAAKASEDRGPRYPARTRSQPELCGQHSASLGITIPITTSDSPKVKDALRATQAEFKL